MNSVAQDIKSRINIVDFIGEYIRLNKAGANWKALCPFHSEKSPSFMINEEKQIWHCFGCGKGGDVFGFLMEIESIEFKEALKILAEKTGVEIPSYKGKNQSDNKNEIDRKRILEILELAAKFYEKQLWDGSGREKILLYLKNRGLKEESIKEFRLGYAPGGWDNILKFMTGRGYSTEEVAKTGLLVNKSELSSASRHYDRFRDRITFPIMDVMGQVVGFSARVAPGGDESQAKYVNTPETEVYHKSKVLYGLSRAKQEIKNKNSVIVVEGNMDVIAAHQSGIKNTVAVSGTALTPDQVDTIKRYTNKIKMLFDMDNAGEQATQRSAEICFQKDMNVSVITLSEGKDAAELVEKNPENFIQAAEDAVPIMEYFFKQSFKKHDKEKVEEKKAIVAELLNIIKNFGNAIEKSHWIKKLSQKLDVGEDILLATLKKVEDRFQGKPEKILSPVKIKKTRMELLQDKIIALMLNVPNLWEEICAKREIQEYFANRKEFSEVFNQRREAGYFFEKFLFQIEDQSKRDFLQKLYFETRYVSGADEIKEQDFSDAREQFEYCFNELKKEYNKNKLKILSQDIKKSEEEGDKEGKILLMKEFNRLLEEIK